MPYREDADTNRPLSPYAASKKAAETLAYTYHYLHGLDVSIPRYFTVYGPAGRPDMSVFRFVRRIAEGEPIIVFGDGMQERDFTYVDDIARGTVAALRPFGYEVINLGGDRPVALAAVIDQIASLLGKKPVVDRRPPHPADVRETWADVGKARAPARLEAPDRRGRGAAAVRPMVPGKPRPGRFAEVGRLKRLAAAPVVVCRFLVLRHQGLPNAGLRTRSGVVESPNAVHHALELLRA